MKRTKSCVECECTKENGEKVGGCPIVEFSGGMVCPHCEYSVPIPDDDLCCSLDFGMFDCPYGVENPIPKEKLDQFRKEFYKENI